MKPMLGVAVVAVALGLWAGFSGWSLAPIMTAVDSALAVLIGGNLLFCSWVWWRAKPGSGDAMVLPTLILLSVAMLIGILPRLLWPAANALHMAGSVASVLIVTVLTVAEVRKRRKLRRQSTPV